MTDAFALSINDILKQLILAVKLHKTLIYQKFIKISHFDTHINLTIIRGKSPSRAFRPVRFFWGVILGYGQSGKYKTCAVYDWVTLTLSPTKKLLCAGRYDMKRFWRFDSKHSWSSDFVKLFLSAKEGFIRKSEFAYRLSPRSYGRFTILQDKNFLEWMKNRLKINVWRNLFLRWLTQDGCVFESCSSRIEQHFSK